MPLMTSIKKQLDLYSSTLKKVALKDSNMERATQINRAYGNACIFYSIIQNNRDAFEFNFSHELKYLFTSANLSDGGNPVAKIIDLIYSRSLVYAKSDISDSDNTTIYTACKVNETRVKGGGVNYGWQNYFLEAFGIISQNIIL